MLDTREDPDPELHRLEQAVARAVSDLRLETTMTELLSVSTLGLMLSLFLGLLRV